MTYDKYRATFGKDWNSAPRLHLGNKPTPKVGQWITVNRHNCEVDYIYGNHITLSFPAPLDKRAPAPAPPESMTFEISSEPANGAEFSTRFEFNARKCCS